ncbi:MAG TPA: hypothetical protein VK141_11340 [Nitrosomonas sp.]|nr:hypothetical protein [Nitrosomonas sp.]
MLNPIQPTFQRAHVAINREAQQRSSIMRLKHGESSPARQVPIRRCA